MAAFAGAFQSGTAADDVVVTGVGFTPQLVIVFGQELAATDPLDPVGGTINGFFGASDGSSQFVNAFRHVDGSSATASLARNDMCIVYLGSDAGQGTISAMSSDGFTVTFSEAPDTDRFINFLALGGTDLTNIAIGEFDFAGTSGSVTGVGFQPDAVLVALAGTADHNTEKTDLSVFSLAVYDGTNDGVGMAYKKENHTIDTARSTFQTDAGSTESINGFSNDGSGSPDVGANFASLDADGFSWTQVVTGATFRGFYIAFKGGSYLAGSATTPNATTGNEAIGSVGFTPEAVLAFTISTTGDANAAGPVIGFATGATEVCYMGWVSEHDTDNAVAAQGTDQFLPLMDPTDFAGSFDEECAFVSFGADGFTVNWTVSEAATNNWGYFAMLGGSAPSGFGSGIIWADGIT